VPVLVFLGAVLLIVVFAVARALAHVIEAHAALAAGIALIGIPALAGALFAIFRGTMRHVILSVPAHPPKPRLPAPAPRREIEAAPERPADPFSADAPAWAQLAEDAEREELARRGPREARPLLTCEGPGCSHVLDDEPWIVDVEGDGRAERHSFCSGECAELWQARDQEGTRQLGRQHRNA
jgi:hypothetical protein